MNHWCTTRCYPQICVTLSYNPFCDSATNIDGINDCIGNTLTKNIMEGLLSAKAKERKIKSLKKILARFEFGKYRMIIPDCLNKHYSVIEISINNDSDNYITNNKGGK